MSVLEGFVSSKLCNLVGKDMVQCFVLKLTTGKYFSLNKKGFLAEFYYLLNKAKCRSEGKADGRGGDHGILGSC